ncbi:hypothetical protein P873_14310 [Arenimonas composti TR7-09 = DSM 18010]|uniref:DUF4349 domain-containing protein n=2 Tax=Arenimonas TaxID=490567 RepID=A0A091BBY2_9GAMM|nr:hypothetical protein P873_14310 [Arenimonas composti TR7-09 = DSM 18010]
MVWTLALVLAVGGCHKVDQAGAPASAPVAEGGRERGADGFVGQTNAEGSFLAYSHDATIRVDAAQIGARVDAVREACMQRRFGDCTVLGESQQAGDHPSGNLRVRAVPEAIQPLVALAAEGGELAARSTSAEDLADAVRDNGLRRSRLEKQHARLLEYLDRDDLAADALVSLSGQLAQIEAELQYAEQEAAMQQRRIRTNLLTLNFRTDGVTLETSEIGDALHEAVDILDASTAVLITIAVALLPFAVAGWILFLVVRGLWRRRKARSERRVTSNE